MSHQEISKGTKAVAAFVSDPVELFVICRAGLVFSRVYRLPRASVNSRDYSRGSTAGLPRNRRYARLIKPRRIRYGRDRSRALYLATSYVAYRTKFNDLANRYRNRNVSFFERAGMDPLRFTRRFNSCETNAYFSARINVAHSNI